MTAVGSIEGGGALGIIEHLDITTIENDIKKNEAALAEFEKSLEAKAKTPAVQDKIKRFKENIIELKDKRKKALAALSKGASENLSNLVKEVREKAPEVKYEVKRYIDRMTGFAVQAYIPQNFDGSLDIYFSGDGHTNDRTVAEMRVAGKAQSKWKNALKSAVVVIEGDKRYINKEKSQRYRALKKSGTFAGILSGLEEQLGAKAKSIHVMGWSRGEEAVRNILDSGDARDRLTAVSLLDATYGNPQAFIDFARRGGKVNVAYQPNARTQAQALAIQQEAGANPRVRVIAAHGMTHREISQNFMGRFMGAEYPVATHQSDTVSTLPSASPDRVQRQEQAVEAYGEEHLKDFLKAFQERKIDDKSLKEFSQWALKQKDVEVLRRAQTTIEENLKDPNAKYTKLAAEYLTTLPEKKNGHFSFSVDFKGNEVAEWKIFGAGHLLPPSVKAIRVYDDHGTLLFDNAQRDMRDGRIGYFDARGRYAYIHTGYTIEVLAAGDNAQQQAKENERYEQEERTLVLKDELKKYLNFKNFAGIEVDDLYFEQRLNALQQTLPSQWWEEFKEKKYGQQELNAVFEKEFAGDLMLIENLTHLRNQGAREKIYMSDMSRYKTDTRFAPLRERAFNKDELAAFQKEKLEGKDISEFTLDSRDVVSDEPFIEGTDDFGSPVTLRKGAMRAFGNAKRIAASMGIQLRVTSSYRTLAQQQHLHSDACARHGVEGARKWVATPGGSPHHTGGTLDLHAVINGKGGGRHPNQKYLKEIMNRAGFVNYLPEPWHWEIYTTRWKKISRMPGTVYAKAITRG